MARKVRARDALILKLMEVGFKLTIGSEEIADMNSWLMFHDKTLFVAVHEKSEDFLVMTMGKGAEPVLKAKNGWSGLLDMDLFNKIENAIYEQVAE